MIEQRKRHFLIFLPIWIIPVFLITFGSLINFHQNKIWGKQLMPHSFVTPRDKAKIVKIQDVKNQVTDLFNCENTETISVFQPVIRITYMAPADDTDLHFLHSYDLRGPPVS